MKKKEFIKLLEEKLSVLDEEELKDIIDEYKDTIDEKVKHGKKEEEAVADFGSIDELTKEILKAYKINPKYGEKKDNVKDVLNDCESLIKRGAKNLANFSKKMVEDFKNNDNDLTVELIFEILIKSVILLILFAVLRFPFWIINELGRSILDIAFYPLDELLMVIWDIILFLLYFICCVLIAIAMFKEYFNNSKSSEKEVKKSKKKEVEKISKSENVKEEKVEIENKKVSGESVSGVIGKILKVIFQIFIVIVCLIPLWFATFGTLIVFVLSIYYLCIGINTIGILLCSFGLLVLFGYASNIFHHIAFNHKRVYFTPFIVSLIFISVGFLLTIDMVARIDYVDTMPYLGFHYKTDTYEFNIDRFTKIGTYHDIEYTIDNSIEDNKMKMEVLYYDDLIKINYYETDYDMDIDYGYSHYIGIYSSHNVGYNNRWKLYNTVIDNLKDNKLYRYDLLYDYDIKVYVNEKTMDLIKTGI